MKEEWRDIPGYENFYQVSNLGKVKSLNYNKQGFECILISSISKSKYVNYYKNSLCKNGKSKTHKVHMLVAMSFLGYIPNGENKKEVIDHIDGNSLNNRLDNLQIITQKENLRKGNKRTFDRSFQNYGIYKTYNNKFRIIFRIKNNVKSFGTFLNLEDAKKCRDEVLKINF